MWPIHLPVFCGHIEFGQSTRPCLVSLCGSDTEDSLTRPGDHRDANDVRGRTVGGLRGGRKEQVEVRGQRVMHGHERHRAGQVGVEREKKLVPQVRASSAAPQLEAAGGIEGPAAHGRICGSARDITSTAR